MKLVEGLFEGALWNSRYVIFAAVIGSLVAGFAIFYMATVDVVYLVLHILDYANPSLTDVVLNMHMSSPIGLLYLGGSIALIALALYLSHAADHDPNTKEKTADSNFRLIGT